MNQRHPTYIDTQDQWEHLRPAWPACVDECTFFFTLNSRDHLRVAVAMKNQLETEERRKQPSKLNWCKNVLIHIYSLAWHWWSFTLLMCASPFMCLVSSLLITVRVCVCVPCLSVTLCGWNWKSDYPYLCYSSLWMTFCPPRALRFRLLMLLLLPLLFSSPLLATSSLLSAASNSHMVARGKTKSISIFLITSIDL